MSTVEHLEGDEIEGWRLVRTLGRGADGIVYAAEKSGATAAMKLFFPEVLAKNGLAAGRERLELQLALIGKKHHPSLVEIFAGGECEKLQTLFLVMELVPGTSLDKLLGKIPASAIPRLVSQLANAAHFLESMDLVHRDIKPANVVISDDFLTLTLLDLGIVHHAGEKNQDRLSGAEFVATLRYSPPEFVWRIEEGEADGAWRAVTFYQIGATVHDLITGTILFSGADTPRACLYDSVRDRTPIIESSEVEGWLIQVTQACLLKDWRKRLQLVTWDMFDGPLPIDLLQKERRIRLRQIRQEEMMRATNVKLGGASEPNREQQLWLLNNALALELRTYLLDTDIFPKCRIEEDAISNSEYLTQFNFEVDPSRGFSTEVSFSVKLRVDGTTGEATKLMFVASTKNEAIVSATWTELFNVETAFEACRNAFLDAVELMISA